MNNRNGVVQHTGAEDRRAPEKSLQHFAKAELFAVEVGTEDGERVRTLVFRVGDMWYHDPDGQAWVKKLRPIDRTNWLTRKLNDAYTAATSPVEVPKADSVDIFGSNKPVDK